MTAHFNSLNCLLCNKKAFYRCTNNECKFALCKDHFTEYDSKYKRRRVVRLSIKESFPRLAPRNDNDDNSTTFASIDCLETADYNSSASIDCLETPDYNSVNIECTIEEDIQHATRHDELSVGSSSIETNDFMDITEDINIDRDNHSDAESLKDSTVMNNNDLPTWAVEDDDDKSLVSADGYS